MSYSYRDLPIERLSFLVKYGSSLATVHRKMKNGGKIDDPMNIVEEIKRLKEELKVAKQSLIPPSYSLDERGGDEIIETVQGIVKGMIAAYPNHENEGCFKELLDELDEMKDTLRLNRDSKKQQASGTIGELSFSSQVLPFDNNDGAFEKAFAELSPEDNGRLSNCVPFAKHCSVDDFIQQNTVISKGVLINWLIGINVIHDPLEGEHFLSKLVEEPSFNLMHAYRSRKIIISPEFVRSLASLRPEEDLVDILFAGKPPAEGPPSTDISKLLIMVNKSKYRLNDKVIRMPKKSDKFGGGTLLVVHLGNFHRRGVGDVVVDDTFLSKFDEFLIENNRIRFLSLQGISRIQRLPDSVCELSELRVLDLRSCQDLQFLPKEIKYLNQLTCLDLSECYQLDHIPKGIVKLSNLRELLGFIIINDNQQQPKVFAEIDDLKHLTKLIKLTIRSRRMSFPLNEDLKTLKSMVQLMILKVAWVKSISDRSKSTADAPSECYTEGLPATLKKLELHTAPGTKISQLLNLISKRSRYRSLEKLYIKGGNSLQTKLYPDHCCFPNVKMLRLRHLPQLHMSWHDFQLSFPNLRYLQIAHCPNLMFFPCDANGEWLKP